MIKIQTLRYALFLLWIENNIRLCDNENPRILFGEKSARKVYTIKSSNIKNGYTQEYATHAKRLHTERLQTKRLDTKDYTQKNATHLKAAND